MPELSMQKRLAVVRFYFEGLSYEDIARRAGVSKGSVANVIGELKVGQFPQTRGMEDQLESLREVAVAVKRAGWSPPRAALGLAAFRNLAALGIDPGELEQVVALYRELSPHGIETQNFVAAARALRLLQDRTGRGPEELMVWLDELQAKAGELEEQCQQLVPVADHVTDLQNQRENLLQQIAALVAQESEQGFLAEEHAQRLEWLQSEVGRAEQLIRDLGQRYLEREGEAQEASKRLNRARQGLEQLKMMGLPVQLIPELASHLSHATQQQGVDSDHFFEWFLSSLHGAGSLLGLETRVKAKQEELAVLEETRVQTAKEVRACRAQLLASKYQLAEVEAVLVKLRDSWQEEMLNLGSVLKGVAARETAEIRSIGTSFKEELLRSWQECQQIANEWGRLEEAIDSHLMMRPLINLLQGKDGLDPKEVRVVATAICLGLMGCLERASGNWNAGVVLLRVKELLRELERWQAPKALEAR